MLRSVYAFGGTAGSWAELVVYFLLTLSHSFFFLLGMRSGLKITYQVEKNKKLNPRNLINSRLLQATSGKTGAMFLLLTLFEKILTKGFF